MGQPVKTMEGNSGPIPVSDLPNGVYFIQLLDRNNNILKTEKFIKN